MLGEDTLQAVRKEAQVRRAAEVDPDKAGLRLKFRAAAFSHGARGCPGYGFATMQARFSGTTWWAAEPLLLGPHFSQGVQSCGNATMQAHLRLLPCRLAWPDRSCARAAGLVSGG